MHAKKFSMLIWLVSGHFIFSEASERISPIDEHGYCGRGRIPTYPAPHLDATLVSVNTFFRHGIRADYRRTTCFSNGAQTAFSSSLLTSFDIEPMSKEGSCVGQLVKRYGRGFQVGELLDYAETQMFRLAKYLQHAYPLFYGEENLADAFLRSTDVERTLGSMNLLVKNLAGDSPVPSFIVHTDDFEYDPLNLNCQNCQRALEIANSFTSTEEYKDVLKSDEYADCEARWLNEIGTSFDITQSFDCLMAPACAKVPLPGGVVASDELMQCVSDLALELRRLRYGSPEGVEFCQLATYPFMIDLLKNVQRHVSGLWAAHDDTLVCILSAAGLWNGKWPKYASFITIEAYSNDRIRIVWDGAEVGILDNLRMLVMPGVENTTDYKTVCNRQINHENAKYDDESNWPGLAGVTRMLGVLSVVLLVVYF